MNDLKRDSGDGLDKRKSYQTECFVVTGGQGDEVECLVDLPPNFEGDPTPAVLWIHGGPMAFDYPGFYMRSAVLTAAGYVVLHVNYHGLTSYGEKFTMSVHGDWGRREEDCRCDLSNTEQLYVSLKKRGVESELVIYPSEYHVFEQPAHLIDRLEKTLD